MSIGSILMPHKRARKKDNNKQTHKSFIINMLNQIIHISYPLFTKVFAKAI